MRYFCHFQPHEVPEAYKTKIRPDRQVVQSSSLKKKKKKTKAKDIKLIQIEEEDYLKMEAQKVGKCYQNGLFCCTFACIESRFPDFGN